MDPGGTTPAGSGGEHVFHYSPDDDDQPAIAIAKAVSWVKDVDVCDLEPLHGAVDTEELDALFGNQSAGREFYRSSNDRATANPTVTFRYEGCRVVVTSDEIRVSRG